MREYKLNDIMPTDIKSQAERDWIYNACDCVITAEVLEILLPQLDNHTAATYAFSRELQAPILEMRLRGIKVDSARKADVIESYYDSLDHLETNLERIVREGVGFVGFNWRSNDHLKELFYDRLGIPVIRRQGRPTVNRDALERMEAYGVAQPIVRHLEAMREIGKKISMLKTEIDPDGRMRTSYNIGGTTTGRLSSSFSEFGTGTNLQNIEESLRSVFIADPGMKIAYVDGEQIQSRIVGAVEWELLSDPTYLDACESGDLHTYVSRMCDPTLPWTGNLKEDKEIAERLWYRHHSLRKLCKSIGHGTNFMGGPKTLNYMYKVEMELIASFQAKYFKAFPGHQRWHARFQRELIETGRIIALTGRKRQFWGRRGDQDTLREALAFEAQADEAYIVNTGMLNVWRARDVQLLLHGHDALIVQYPEAKEDEIIPKILNQLRCPIILKGDREFLVPFGCKTGWNWGEHSEENLDGLKTYRPGDKRIRTAETSILDRVIRRIHR